MKKVKLIARANIIGIDDDNGLKALDGYFESPFCDVDENLSQHQIADMLIERYEKEISDIHYSTIEIIFD